MMALSLRLHIACRRGLVLLSVLLALLLPGNIPQANAQPAPGAYYLALGDSLAYGTSAEGVAVDPTCAAPDAVGYVCLVYRYLRAARPDLALVNLAQPLIDSCELLRGYGNGSPCTRPLPASVPAAIPLAVDFIKAHPGQVNLITLNVGGNDLLPLLPDAVTDPLGTAAKLPGVFQTFTANLDDALAQLRAAAGPGTKIILVNQYNPLGGVPSPPLPSGLPEVASGAINGMNSLMKTSAASYGATYADVAAAFDAAPGGASVLTWVPPTLASGDPTKLNILPTADGYRVYAVVVVKATGILAPLTVKARLAAARPRAGRPSRVHVTTVPYSLVTVRLKARGGRSSNGRGEADGTGAFGVRLRVPRPAGRGTLQVCAVDLAGQSTCSTTRYLSR